MVLAGAAVGVGGWLIQSGTRTSAPPLPSAADAWPGLPLPTPRTTQPGPGSEAVGMAFSKPVRIRIPRIDVDAPIAEVDLDANGNLPAPSAVDRRLAGWYEQSAAPGTSGNAVIDGHVDTLDGPAVFYSLGALHRGDTIDIIRADRSTAEFTADAIEVYPKGAVPADRVFGAAEQPQLRLITCGGTYTKATGYQGTVVVYGHLARAVPAP
ncbi:class F sortase [Kitasatospora sp. NPDC059571]|uniref:class F sortase n=1 Tax=Kitasatospora sp. NPDC059571 TaxID=3346871 RepID=UPI0036894D08